MAVTVGGQGVLGVAIEAVQGTWLTPAKFIPILSESLEFVEDKVMRKPIIGVNDPFAAKQGFTHIEGDIVFELTADTLIYFLYAMNMSIVKSGSGTYTYTCTPSTYSTPNKTLSITVVRNDVVFGYAGCIVSSLEVTMQDNIMVGTMTIMGMTETSQTEPTPTWPTTDVAGPGIVDIKFGGTSRTDCDSFSISIDDGAEPFYPIRTGGIRSAKEIRFGEREVTLSFDLDFENNTDYTAFKAQTQPAVIVQATIAADNDIKFDFKKCTWMNYAPVLSAVGDIVRATGVELRPVYDSVTSKVAEITVKTTVSIT